MERPSAKILQYEGKDKHGFRYYIARDLYVYQQFPCDRDYWVEGYNMRGKFRGWISSVPAWERTLNQLIVTK